MTASTLPLLASVHDAVAWLRDKSIGVELGPLDVELVGVARHDPPVVHAATFMGFQHSDGDAGAMAPSPSVRGLQAWERNGLSRLMAGGDIVVQATPRGARMMGPIRARPDCLSCHRGHREGDVLGALSYGLGHIVASPDHPGRRSCRP